MQIHDKLPYAKQHIRSISRHDDQDAAIRLAALDHLVKFIEAEKAAIHERVQAKIDAQVGAEVQA